MTEWATLELKREQHRLTHFEGNKTVRGLCKCARPFPMKRIACIPPGYSYIELWWSCEVGPRRRRERVVCECRALGLLAAYSQVGQVRQAHFARLDEQNGGERVAR